MMKSCTTAAAAALLLGTALAGNATVSPQNCPQTNVCFSLSIPDATASSGNGDIFFQMSAPTSYSWVALGQGTGMSGANIFVMYTSSNGQNVTLSPRLGTGHVQPQHNADAQVTLLEGSGVSGGMMTANVKCSSCSSWSGGSMDFTSSSGKWIYALGTGSSMNSDDVSATIKQHSPTGSGPFDWDMSKAKGGNEVNPFLTQDQSTGSSNSTTSSGSTNATSTTTSASGTVSATGAVSCTPDASSSATAGGPPWSHGNKKRNACPEGSSPVNGTLTQDAETFDPTSFNRVATVHGVFASLAFVALFPVGGILIRLGNFTNLVWIHAGLQLLAYAIYAIAFAMGIWLTRTLQPTSHAHPLIGSLIFLIFLSQPITGWLHHKFFVRFGGRGKASMFHLVIGRAAILIGMANGGLGLRLAGASPGAHIAYSVVALIMAVTYIASIVMGELRRKRAAKAREVQSQRMQREDDTTLDDLPARTETHVPKYT